MNEQEFRGALRGVMVAGSPPPPMSPQAALDVARHAGRRRRTVLAGAAAALAVMLIAIGTAVAPGLPHLRPDQVGSALGSESPRASTARTLLGTEPPAGGETVWPTGPDGQPQSDRTAYAGPRHEQAAVLLDRLIEVAPGGFTIPEQTNFQPPGSENDPELAHSYWGRAYQAEFTERVGGDEVWSYLASLSLSRAGGTGGLRVEVRTRHNKLPVDACELTRAVLANYSWDCEVVQVGDSRVGVVRPVPAQLGDGLQDVGVSQLATFRHPDGTVVIVTQERQFSAAPGLAQLPLPTRRLAELAADPRFRLE